MMSGIDGYPFAPDRASLPSDADIPDLNIKRTNFLNKHLTNLYLSDIVKARRACVLCGIHASTNLLKTVLRLY